MELVSLDDSIIESAALSLCGICLIALGVTNSSWCSTWNESFRCGVALLFPFLYGMDPALAFIFFVAVYQAANYGGSITAIAINAPGTPASVVTAIDGYELTKQGLPGKALGTAVFSSAFGGIVGAVVLIFAAQFIARFGLKFGPAEYFWLAVFGLSTVIAFGGTNWLKALIGILIGLLLATVGLDQFSGEPRYTFNIIDLFDGISFIPAMIGLFALAEIFSQIEAEQHHEIVDSKSFSNKLPSLTEIFNSFRTLVKSSFIGTFIGVIPGAGATIASFISYGEAKRSSKEPDKIGKGSLEGIVASEAANSSSVGGALVPLLALGIPGSATDAVLLGALSLHGLAAGPELFNSNPDIAYGIFVSVFAANFFILIFGLLGNSVWLKVISTPKALLYTYVIAMCVLGSYTIRNSLFDSWICLGFGVVGWVLDKVGIKPAPIVLGLVLGPMIEINFRRALLAGGYELLYDSPLAIIIAGLTVLSCLFPLLKLCLFSMPKNPLP
ncbi:MAG: tripartite tricarboxylate transporter permease [Bdellovibrionota bacterium]